jgi:DNA polymerase-3 subunit alpha
LDKHEQQLKKLASGTIASFKERSSNGEVKAGGVVTALKLKNTKKGERYASFQLEDRTGFIEVLVWPDLYRRCAETLVQDDPILVRAKLEVGEERVQLIANDVTPLAGAASRPERRPQGARDSVKSGEAGAAVHFYIGGSSATSEGLNRLHETLRLFPGDRTVFLHLRTANRGETVIELPEHFKVAPSPELFQAAEQLFGSRIVTNPLDI